MLNREWFKRHESQRVRDTNIVELWEKQKQDAIGIEKELRCLTKPRPKGVHGQHLSEKNLHRSEFNHILRALWFELPGNFKQLHPYSYGIPEFPHDKVVDQMSQAIASFLFQGIGKISVVNNIKKEIYEVKVPLASGINFFYDHYFHKTIVVTPFL